jgi:hypothetical protein
MDGTNVQGYKVHDTCAIDKDGKFGASNFNFLLVKTQAGF